MMDFPHWREMNFSAILIWLSFYGIIILVVQQVIRSLLRRIRQWRNPALVEKPKIEIDDYQILRPRKATSMAYLLYFCGGILTGSHHIYLESHAYAILHQSSLGFLGVGGMLDLFLLPIYVWRYNRNKTHSQAPKDYSGGRVLGRLSCCWLLQILMLLAFFFVTPMILEKTDLIPLGQKQAKLSMNPYDLLG